MSDEKKPESESEKMAPEVSEAMTRVMALYMEMMTRDLSNVIYEFLGNNTEKYPCVGPVQKMVPAVLANLAGLVGAKVEAPLPQLMAMMLAHYKDAGTECGVAIINSDTGETTDLTGKQTGALAEILDKAQQSLTKAESKTEAPESKSSESRAESVPDPKVKASHTSDQPSETCGCTRCRLNLVNGGSVGDSGFLIMKPGNA